MTWWSKGGVTDIDNLVLACWSCHHHLHHHGWQVTCRPDGRFTIRRPQQPLRHTA